MEAQEQREPNESRIKILLVDDHPIVRQGLRLVIDQEPDLVVCGEAEDAHEALEAIGKLEPDLAIIDVCLKGSDGLDLMKDVKIRYPDVLVLVLSMHEESLYAERVLRAGARGYMMKEEATHHVITAIRQILAGELYLSERMSSRMLHEFIDGPREMGGSPVDCLTDRELEVFQLIGRGLGTRQIAGKLHLSVKTIETYRAHIKKKLNLKNASELVQHAILWGQDSTTTR